MGYNKFSKKEHKWLAEEVKPRYDKEVTQDGKSMFMFSKDITPIYNKKFKQKRSANSIEGWVNRNFNKTNGVGGRKAKNPAKLFMKSNFVLVVAGNLMGFESEDEVKAFLEQSAILGGVKLFVTRPVNIKFDIKIG